MIEVLYTNLLFFYKLSEKGVQGVQGVRIASDIFKNTSSRLHSPRMRAAYVFVLIPILLHTKYCLIPLVLRCLSSSLMAVTINCCACSSIGFFHHYFFNEVIVFFRTSLNNVKLIFHSWRENRILLYHQECIILQK